MNDRERKLAIGSDDAHDKHAVATRENRNFAAVLEALAVVNGDSVADFDCILHFRSPAVKSVSVIERMTCPYMYVNSYFENNLRATSS